MKKNAFFAFIVLLGSFSEAQTIKIMVNNDVSYSYSQMKKNHAYNALFIDIRQDEMTEYMFFVQSKIENNGKYDHSAIITNLEAQKNPVYLVLDFPYNDNGTTVKKTIFVFWCPDKARNSEKLTYTSCKEKLKLSLTGIDKSIQIHKTDEISEEKIVALIKGS